MSLSPEFRAFLEDQMAEFGKVSVNRMFSGAGIYRDGLMFALVARDVLFFKTDAESRPLFEAEGLSPFSYDTKDGKRTLTSYFKAPETCMDDLSEMALWCRRAYDAALRSKPKKKAKA